MKASTKRFAALFTGCIVADVAANFYITIGLDGDLSAFSLGDLWNFTRYSWDLGVFCCLRIVLVLLALATSTTVGSEDFYKTGSSTAGSWSCLAHCFRPKSRREDSTVGALNGDYTSLRSVDEPPADGTVSIVTEGGAPEEDFAATVKVPLGPGISRGKMTVLRQQRTLDVKKVALRNKNVVFGIIFVLCTGSSVYCGVKCVSYNFRTTDFFWHALVMGTLPIWINLEFFLLRVLSNTILKTEGRMFKGVHHHPMMLKQLPCNWCDLCHKRIKEKQGWRCHMCDFDVCNHCAMRENKAGAEGMLRGDKGIKVTKEVTSYRYFCRALSLISAHYGYVAVSVMCLLVNCTTQLLIPNYTGKILDSVARKDTGVFNDSIRTYTIFAVVTGFFGAIRNLAVSITGRKVSADVRKKLFGSIMVQDIAFFDGQMTGQLTSRLTNDASGMVSPMNTLMNTILTNVIYLFGGLVLCVYTSWRLSIIAFTTIGPIIFLTTLYAKFSRGLNRQIWSALADANAVATEAFSNVRTVRAFGQDKNEIKKFDTSITHAMSRGIIDAIAAAGTFAITNYMDLGASLLILAYGGYEAMSNNGNLTVGNLITFQLYWGMINNAYQSLTGVWSSLTRAGAAATRVLTLMDNLPDIDLHKGIVVDRTTNFNIRLKNLHFYYQMRPDNVVLRNLNLEIGHEKVVALVGRSGGGKSTLAHLLMRFYDPRKGAILLNGVDYKEYNLSTLHNSIGIVAQDTSLFNRTIEENIAYGHEEYTPEEVCEAGRLANAHDFIMELDEGYQTKVGERGVRLSGGQKQRIALARVFLRKPKLLILDEATSALDAESEALVQESIDRLINMGGCTVVLIAHRLSTVMKADKIAVVDKGAIVEEGTHKELVKTGGLYAQLVSRQQAKDDENLNVDQLIDGIREVDGDEDEKDT